MGFVVRLPGTASLVLSALGLSDPGLPPPRSLPPTARNHLRDHRGPAGLQHYNPKRQALFGTTTCTPASPSDVSISLRRRRQRQRPARADRFAKGLASINLPEPSGLQPRLKAQARSDPLMLNAAGGPNATPCIDDPAPLGRGQRHHDRTSASWASGRHPQGRVGQGPPREPVDGVLDDQRLRESRSTPSTWCSARASPRPASTKLTVPASATNKYAEPPMRNNPPNRAPRRRWRRGARPRRPPRKLIRPQRGVKFTSLDRLRETPRRRCSTTGTATLRSRNDRVVKEPVNALDMAVRVTTDPTEELIDSVAFIVLGKEDEQWAPGRCRPGTRPPDRPSQPFWNKSKEDCNYNGKNVTPGQARRCDFITTPTTPTLAAAATSSPMFLDLFNTPTPVGTCRWSRWSRTTRRRRQRVPLRPALPAGTDTIDEQLRLRDPRRQEMGSASGVGLVGPSTGPEPSDTWWDPRYVRNVWKDGIEYAATGGFDGTTSSRWASCSLRPAHRRHGPHPENEQWRHLGIDLRRPDGRVLTIENGTGGPSVVWAGRRGPATRSSRSAPGPRPPGMSRRGLPRRRERGHEVAQGPGAAHGGGPSSASASSWAGTLVAPKKRVDILADRLAVMSRTSSPTPVAVKRAEVGHDGRHAGRRRGALSVRGRPRHARDGRAGLLRRDRRVRRGEPAPVDAGRQGARRRGRPRRGQPGGAGASSRAPSG